MNAANLPRVKKVLNSLSLGECQQVWVELVGAQTAAEVATAVDGLLSRHGLERYVRPNQATAQ